MTDIQKKPVSVAKKDVSDLIYQRIDIAYDSTTQDLAAKTL